MEDIEDIGGHFCLLEDIIDKKSRGLEDILKIHGILEDIMEIWEDIPVFPNFTRPKSIRPSEENNFQLMGGMCIKLFTVRGGMKFTLQMARMAFKWSS